MVFEMTIIQDVSIVTIPQRLDADTAPGLESEVRAVLARSPKKMIFDFSRTDYIASAGLKALLTISRDMMKTGGQVALAGLRPAVYRVFEIAGFTSIFTICQSREEALQKMK